MKCPICGSEIEIAEEMDYEELISRDSSLEAFLFDKPRWKEVYHIYKCGGVPCCETNGMEDGN